MTVLQWALLIVGAIAVIAIYAASRRREPRGADVPAAAPRTAGKLPGANQMDMFSRDREGSEFDEFGVGKPRKRTAPVAGESGAPAAPPAHADRPLRPAVPEPEPVEEMIVTLLIAEREGTAINGPKIHAALAHNRLEFGDRRIYHRMAGGQPVFSVASLVKPGVLDPAEQAGFSTPGLTVFMVLPGPVKPVGALKDMIATARALATALNAEVFDVGRQHFDDESSRKLSASVEAWVKRNGA